MLALVDIWQKIMIMKMIMKMAEMILKTETEMEITRMAMEMGMGTLMGVLMAEGSVKAPYTSGSKDPSLKMVKVDGSMLSQVGLAPVMNQGKEHQSVSLQQKEQA